MCVGGVPSGTNALGRLLETIAGIVPAIDRLTGPVLERGELGSDSVPTLAFQQDDVKVAHSQFQLYESIRKLESGGQNGSAGNILFEFLYKVIIWTFLSMPFMGQKDHEVVECVWTSLIVHEHWRDYIESEGATEVYLFLNFVVRYTIRVKKGTGRKFFFLWMYNEELVNRLQRNVFKVTVRSSSGSNMIYFCVYRLFTACLPHPYSLRKIRNGCSIASPTFHMKP
jgi:hypothetical protein